MRKHTEQKDDGRYIIFYEFEDESASKENAASANAKRESRERESENR